METIARSEHASGDRLSTQGNLLPSSTFGFTIETKIRCHQTGRVSYKRDAGSNVLSLTIPMSAAVNQNDVEEYKVSHVYVPYQFPTAVLLLTV